MENLDKINSFSKYAKLLFTELIKAIDSNDKENTDRFTKELTDLLKEVKDNIDDKDKGSYMYIIDVINNFLEIANNVKKSQKMSYEEVTHELIYHDIDDPIYRRAREQKYDGPLSFSNQIEDYHRIIKKRKEILDIDLFISKLINLASKEKTGIDELPDYYYMYQIPNDVEASDIFDAETLGQIITICEDISNDNIIMINKNFKCIIDDKEYTIAVKKYPFSITIKCSDGRKLKTSINFKTKDVHYFDQEGYYTLYSTDISLSFPVCNKKVLESKISVENEGSFNKDYGDLLASVTKPISPNGRLIPWKYLCLHQDKFINKEEVGVIYKQLKKFIRGLTTTNPSERIMNLARTLNKEEKLELIKKLKGTI